MYTGSEDNEELMGLPDEEKKISVEVEHSFDYDINKVETGTSFTPAEPKKRVEPIIEKRKDNGGRRRKKSSDLF